MPKARVLLVDDEVEFATVVAERMRGRGFEVDTAESGKDCLEMVKKKTYDAIVLDLAMPEMDGMETMQHILEYDSTLQVIILTGRGSIQKGVEAVKKGAVDFLEKPADIDDLTGKINTAQRTRMELFEEDIEKKMTDIMRKKGW